MLLNRISKKLIGVIVMPAVILSCQSRKQPDLTSRDITKTLDAMTGVMVHDVTNPPLAARFFTYSCLAGYEVVAENNPGFKTMRGRLNGYPEIKKPADIADYNYQLAAMLSMLQTAEKLQPSGALLKQAEDKLVDSCKQLGFSSQIIEGSTQYAAAISKQILAYAKADRYNRISNYKRYTPSGKAGSWEPTPPMYMLPVEPYFNTVRPFTLDTSSQFLPEAPAPFSTSKGSAFYQKALAVYNAGGAALTDEHRTIAGFWDCNPFAVDNNGHLMVGIKKISPGAHWMGIAGIACAEAKVPFAKAMLIHTAVAIGLTDSFICCWDAKYKFNRIRPETAIRQCIDPNWRPLLQTPPFPEYLSGHSVASTTSAVILSHYFGDHFSYIDDVEAGYHIAPRHFSSFAEAAREAAVSRFWGGIHFMDAIENGSTQGEKIGKWVLSKLADTE